MLVDHSVCGETFIVRHKQLKISKERDKQYSRKRKWQRQRQREENLLLSLQQEKDESCFLQSLEFSSRNPGFGLRGEDHEGHDDCSNDAKDGMQLHFCFKKNILWLLITV